MIVITGATGNVGKKTTELLLKENAKLRLIARKEASLAAFSGKAEIKVGNLKDTAFLTEAYTGADVVLVMMPTDYTESDVKAHQAAEVASITQAIQKSGVKKVVVISSVGAHTTEKTGIVAGLAHLEANLKKLEGVDILFLRPCYFMENLLGNIGIIKGMGIHGTPMVADKPFPFIATQDIAAVAASNLLHPTFTGKMVKPLLGARSYTMKEVTAILGAAIGKPELPYVQFPYDQAKAGMVQAGLSASIADAFVELNQGANEGVLDFEVRTPESTTPTTLEQFASSTFAYVYNM